MLNRILVGLVLAAGLFASVETVQAYTAAQREQIRAMPITTRPYRPGHFYGNTVRRLHRIRGGY
ncbi:MAG TPA: hypothetical protein VG433_00700 [Pirellulales bacterium]|jgi:hypothetical protein|nr:hypothetical protein [Pirellulales bacterium]